MQGIEKLTVLPWAPTAHGPTAGGIIPGHQHGSPRPECLRRDMLWVTPRWKHDLKNAHFPDPLILGKSQVEPWSITHAEYGSRGSPHMMSKIRFSLCFSGMGVAEVGPACPKGVPAQVKSPSPSVWKAEHVLNSTVLLGFMQQPWKHQELNRHCFSLSSSSRSCWCSFFVFDFLNLEFLPSMSTLALVLAIFHIYIKVWKWQDFPNLWKCKCKYKKILFWCSLIFQAF